MRIARSLLMMFTLACAVLPASPSLANDGKGRWGGLYIGASVGWQQTDYSSELRGFPGDLVTGDHTSGIAGLHLGFQHQMGRLVLGVEASLSGTGLFSSLSGAIPGGTPECLGVAGSAIFSCQAGLSRLMTLGPKLGYAFSDRLMIYGTGGWAVGNIRDQVTVNSVAVGATQDRHNGWFIGAGVEHALTRNWVVGLEYLHVEFDSKFRCETVVGGGCLAGESRTGAADTDIIRARLSFKFGRDHGDPLK